MAPGKGKRGSRPLAGRDFTDGVRALDRSGRPLDEEGFERLWIALRKAVRSEIVRRGLWDCPPSYLGILGRQRWTEPPSRSSSIQAGDALEELVGDCYAYIFLKRYQSLKAQLRVKPTIEGLVFRCIRNFLHERQRRSDPLGFHVYRRLRAAVRNQVAAGDLLVIAGDPRIRNETVLAFDPSAAPDAPERLSAAAARWADDLLPELMTQTGRARAQILDRLERRLAGLRDSGVSAFVFGDLIRPLKREVRTRWQRIHQRTLGEPARDTADGELGRLLRWVLPEAHFEERQNFDQLKVCVTRGLATAQVNERTRTYLERLWGYLVRFADEASWPDAPERLPSRRRLAAELTIPRDRLPGLLATLGELLVSCHAAISGQRRVS